MPAAHAERSDLSSDDPMPLAVGRHLLGRAIEEHGWLAIALVVVLVLLVIHWPRVTAWVERWWFGD